MAHVLLHRHHISRFILSRQFDFGHRSDVVRWVTEESRGRRGGRGGSNQGEWTPTLKYSQGSAKVTHIVLDEFFRKPNKRLKIERFGGKLMRRGWQNVRKERGTSLNIRNRLRTFRAKATTICSPVRAEGSETTIIARKWACGPRPSRARTSIRTPWAWTGRAEKREKYATVARLYDDYLLTGWHQQMSDELSRKTFQSVRFSSRRNVRILLRV